MYELLPLFAGIVLALVTQGLTPRRRLAAILVLGPIAGSMAVWVSGEWLVSWAFILIDTALVMLAAVVTVVALACWRRQPRWLG